MKYFSICPRCPDENSTTEVSYFTSNRIRLCKKHRKKEYTIDKKLSDIIAKHYRLAVEISEIDLELCRVKHGILAC